MRAVHPDAFEAYAALADARGCTVEAARDLPEAGRFRARSRVIHVGNVPARLEKWATELPEHNLYLQVASVRSGATRAGLDSLDCARVLWVDVDDAACVYALDEIAALCDHARVPYPSMVVQTSERGWHLYWALTLPFPLFDPGEQSRFRRVLYGLAQRLRGDPRATDPARVLRPPGTVNHASRAKQAAGRAPTFPVRIVHG